MGSPYVLIKGHGSGTRPGSKSGRNVGTSRSPWAYAPRAQGARIKAFVGSQIRWDPMITLVDECTEEQN